MYLPIISTIIGVLPLLENKEIRQICYLNFEDEETYDLKSLAIKMTIHYLDLYNSAFEDGKRNIFGLTSLLAVSPTWKSVSMDTKCCTKI